MRPSGGGVHPIAYGIATRAEFAFETLKHGFKTPHPIPFEVGATQGSTCTPIICPSWLPDREAGNMRAREAISGSWMFLKGYFGAPW